MKKLLRLNQEEIKVIKKEIESIFGKSEIYIFGSQTDLKKRGGDIDIFITPINRENLFKKKLKLKVILADKLLKPIDIVIDKNNEFSKIAKKGVKL